MEIRVKPIGSERVVAETWNATIAKKKLTEFIFADFLNKGNTVGDLLGSVGQGTQGSGQGYQPPTQQVNSGQQGTQVSQNL